MHLDKFGLSLLTAVIITSLNLSADDDGKHYKEHGHKKFKKYEKEKMHKHQHKKQYGKNKMPKEKVEKVIVVHQNTKVVTKPQASETYKVENQSTKELINNRIEETKVNWINKFFDFLN